MTKLTDTRYIRPNVCQHVEFFLFFKFGVYDLNFQLLMKKCEVISVDLMKCKVLTILGKTLTDWTISGEWHF